LQQKRQLLRVFQPISSSTSSSTPRIRAPAVYLGDGGLTLAARINAVSDGVDTDVGAAGLGEMQAPLDKMVMIR
jgi:hypothetical protein